MRAKRLEEDEDKGLKKAERMGKGCGKDGMDRFTRSCNSRVRIPLGRSRPVGGDMNECNETRRDANDCRELIEMGTRLVRICVQAHVS
jgi:hypothetical protein